MPEITTCPDCEKNLRVPDELLGKKVRCPGCGVMFIARAGTGQPDKASERAPSRTPARSEAIAERRSDRDDRDHRRRDDRDRRDEEDRRPRSRYEDDRPRRRYDEEEDDDHRRRRREEDDDRPRRRDDDYPDPRDEYKAWRGVRAGLTMVLISAWLQLAWIGIGALGAGIMLLLGVGLASSAVSAPQNQVPGNVVGGMFGMAAGGLLFIGILVLIGFASGVLRLVGMGMCMQVPQSRRSSARVLAIVAFSIAIAYVLLNLAGTAVRGGINTMQNNNIGAGAELAMLMMALGMSGGGLGWLGGFLNWAAFIVWLLAMRSFCYQVRSDDTGGRVLVYLIADIVFRFLAGMMFFIALISVGIGIFSALGSRTASGAATSAGAGVVIAGVIGGLVGLCYLAMCVWYVLVVQQVRGAVDRKIARL